MRIAAIDVGSTTIKAILVDDGAVRWQDYQRHQARQAVKALEFLTRLEAEAHLTPETDCVVLTGSGAGSIVPLVGGRFVQEVVAVAAAVERLHPTVRFVSEIGGEDMKTIFFTPARNGMGKQVYMQSACSGGTGAFVEKIARKLNVSCEALAKMSYRGKALHRISSKCGIFAENDAISLVNAGVAVDEIIASLFDAVVYQNLATLTKGNTPKPDVLLLGGPNLFFQGLQEAWRKHLAALWAQRKSLMPDNGILDAAILVPENALYYACLGSIEIVTQERKTVFRPYRGTSVLKSWIEERQQAAKAKEGAKPLVADDKELIRFLEKYTPRPTQRPLCAADQMEGPVVIGCDFGSTTVKAVVLSRERELVFSCYSPSRGNPIEDAKVLFRKIREAGCEEISALAVTGYGKDLMKNILGADVPIVETVAHATGALHYFPDADAICDVGGCDIKIMLLRQKSVTDFRLNSQCSSGNGAFLQSIAERYDVQLDEYAERALSTRAMPALMMGCGVFLQSDIVNQLGKGWSVEEIMAALAAVLPLNVWVYAGQFHNLRAVGRKFVLQGGTHRNLAVVKAQVDFIRSKVPEAQILVHPYCGEAGAIGAALLGFEVIKKGLPSKFRGFDVIEALDCVSTNNKDTICQWCTVNCNRTFIDARISGGEGRPWSKVPLAEGWERVITGNSCPKGLVEDVDELRVVKAKLEEAKIEYPNIGELVRDQAFRTKAIA